jgi:hypothetical protein
MDIQRFFKKRKEENKKEDYMTAIYKTAFKGIAIVYIFKFITGKIWIILFAYYGFMSLRKKIKHSINNLKYSKVFKRL